MFPDLTWNDQTSFEQIKDVINSLRLPTFDDEINKGKHITTSIHWVLLGLEGAVYIVCQKVGV